MLFYTLLYENCLMSHHIQLTLQLRVGGLKPGLRGDNPQKAFCPFLIFVAVYNWSPLFKPKI